VRPFIGRLDRVDIQSIGLYIDRDGSISISHESAFMSWTFHFDRTATSEYRFKIGDFAPTGIGWPKISGRRGRPPTTILLLRKLGWMIFRMVQKSGQIFLPLSHNARVWQTDGRTDRQTDRILIVRPRLHSTLSFYMILSLFNPIPTLSSSSSSPLLLCITPSLSSTPHSKLTFYTNFSHYSLPHFFWLISRILWDLIAHRFLFLFLFV